MLWGRSRCARIVAPCVTIPIYFFSWFFGIFRLHVLAFLLWRALFYSDYMNIVSYSELDVDVSPVDTSKYSARVYRACLYLGARALDVMHYLPTSPKTSKMSYRPLFALHALLFLPYRLSAPLPAQSYATKPGRIPFESRQFRRSCFGLSRRVAFFIVFQVLYFQALSVLVMWDMYPPSMIVRELAIRAPRIEVLAVGFEGSPCLPLFSIVVRGCVARFSFQSLVSMPIQMVKVFILRRSSDVGRFLQELCAMLWFSRVSEYIEYDDPHSEGVHALVSW